MSWFDANQPPPTPPSPAPGQVPGYGYGSAIAPWTPQFQAPTAQQAIDSPGLQYALDRARQGGERGAAAKGTLLAAGTQRALNQDAIGVALQGYGDVYNRGLGEYLLGRENFQMNQDRPFAKLSAEANRGLNAAGTANLSGSSYAGNAIDLLTGQGNAQAAGTVGSANAWSGALDNAGSLAYYLAMNRAK